MAEVDNNNEPKVNVPEFEKFSINEYETQFFGFTPKSFLDGVYNAISDYVSDCFGELEKQLANEPSLMKRSTPEQIHQKCDAMLKRFYKSVDNSFDRLEIYLLMKVFEIPPNVLLPEDKIHEGQNHTKEDEAKIDDELLELQRKIKAAKYVNTSLKQELQELDAIESKIKESRTYLENLDKTCQSELGCKESLKFSYEQAMKLHNQLIDNKLMSTEESEAHNSPSSKRKKIKIG